MTMLGKSRSRIMKIRSMIMVMVMITTMMMMMMMMMVMMMKMYWWHPGRSSDRSLRAQYPDKREILFNTLHIESVFTGTEHIYFS